MTNCRFDGCKFGVVVQGDVALDIDGLLMTNTETGILATGDFDINARGVEHHPGDKPDEDQSS